MNNRFGIFGYSLVALAVGLAVFSSACKKDPITAPDPHSLSDDDIVGMVAGALGEASGGIRVQMLDLVKVAQGEELTRERKGGSNVQPVIRSGSQTIDGRQYAYNYAVDYDYYYSANCAHFPDDWGSDIQCVLYGFRMTGTHDTPISSSVDSGFTQPSSGENFLRWDIHLHLLPTRFRMGVVAFARTGTETMKATGLSYQRKLVLQFRLAEIDRATGAIISPLPPHDNRDNVSYFELSGVKASDGFAIERADGQPFHGEIMFNEDNTATVKYGVNAYTVDMNTGVMKKL